MKTVEYILLVAALQVSAQCQDSGAQPAAPCKDSPDTCVPGADGTATFCMALVLTLNNGTALDTSTCVPGDCTTMCKTEQYLTCDSSACGTNLCSATATQASATTLLTGLAKGTIQLAGGILAGGVGLIIGIAATVPKLILSLTGGLSLDKLVAVVNGIPLVGPIVTGVLKGLGILDLAGGVVSTVLNLSNGVLGAVTGALGGVVKTAEGIAGGVLGGLGGLAGGITGSLTLK